MFEIGNIYFTAEILLAEIIFLYSVPKREKFPLRYIGAVLVCLLLSYFFPMPSAIKWNVFYTLFRFLVLFALTIAGMGFCFKISFHALFSACVAGYAVQHISYHVCGLIEKSALFAGFSSEFLSRLSLLEFVFFPAVYLLFFLTLGHFAAKNEFYKKSDIRFNALSIVIVFICVGLTRFSRAFGEFSSVSVKLYSITTCVLALIVQFVLYRLVELKQENQTIRLLWQEDKKQYELSKRTIGLINIKCHDLKHKLSALDGRLPREEIESMKDAVRIYDSGLKTGNEALDVLLTEKSLYCNEEGICMTYTGNGADLSFMNIMDVYSLFGNAVSNAIEAVSCLAVPEKKVIAIVVERKGDLTTINISNYFSGEICFEDGMPVTGKKEEEGYHGFGMKSMNLIAQKYGGSLKASVRGEIFNLGIYLLHPEEARER